jgi:hypothetical protein
VNPTICSYGVAWTKEANEVNTAVYRQRAWEIDGLEGLILGQAATEKTSHMLKNQNKLSTTHNIHKKNLHL